MSLKSYYKSSVTASTLDVAGPVAVSAIGGDAMLTPEDITNTSISTKIVTPAALKRLLTSPPDIGTIAPNTGNFTSITATTVSGAMLASEAETISYAHIAKGVTPQGLKAALLAPAPIGTGAASAGVFTTITAAAVSGAVVASIADAVAGLRNDIVVTPASVLAVLQAPQMIGSGATDAVFTLLKAANVTLGSPLPSSSGGTGLASYDKGTLLTGAALGGLRSVPAATVDGLYLTADPTGSVGLKWTAVATNSLSSGTTAVDPASNTDAINYTVSNKALVPSNVPYVFAAPPTVGGTTPNTGAFRNVNVGGSLALPTPLSVSQGGLGMSTSALGDIPVGINNAYGRLPVGVDGYILQANPATSAGLKWVVPPKAADPTNVKEVVTALPRGYLDIGAPVKTGATTYQFAYIRAKSADNTQDIYIANATLNTGATGANAVAQSSTLAGTVTASGTSVVGTGTAFTTDFQPGDVLNAGTGNAQVVVSIADDTHLTVLGAMSVSGALYRRGGVAPKARYYLHSAGTSLYLTTRSIDLGDTIVDIPASARQLPMQVNLDANALPLGIVDVSDPLHTRYYAVTDPVYSSSGGGSYVIGSCLCRDDADSADIIITEPTTVGTSAGINGVEAAVTYTGTATATGSLVVGSGTAFTSEVAVGDYVMMQNSDAGARVVSIADDTHMTLNRCVTGASAVSYTLAGNAMFTKEVSRFGSNSLYINANSTDYLRVDGLPYQSGAWTMEVWVFQLYLRGNNGIFGTPSSGIFDVYFDSSGFLHMLLTTERTYTYDINVTSAVAYPANQWLHVALTFDGFYYKAYVNGVLGINVAAQGRLSPICYQNGLCIGGGGSSYPMYGYLDEFRFSSVLRYASNFAPANAAFSLDASTVALCHMEAGSAFSMGKYWYSPLTANEQVSVAGQTINYTAYRNAMISSAKAKFGSSSLRLQGQSRDFVRVNMDVPRPALTTGPAQWTLEFWFYPATNLGGTQSMLNALNTNNPIVIAINGTSVYLWLSSMGNSQDLANNYAHSSAVSYGAWHHVAIYYNGYNYKMAVNGSEATVSSNVRTVDWFTITNFNFGTNNSFGSGFDGFIDEFRLSNTCRYNGNFTPSASAWSVDQYTVALNHFEATATTAQNPFNSTLIQRNVNMESISYAIWGVNGLTPTSATQAKFGSRAFTTTAQALPICSTGLVYAGDWTLEAWAYAPASMSTTYLVVFAVGSYVSASYSSGMTLTIFGNSIQLQVTSTAGAQTGTGNIGSAVSAAWHHLAVCYTAATSTYTVWQGGALISTLSSVTAPINPYAWNTLSIGAIAGTNSSTNFSGCYVDELRLSSVVRYSATFTPAASAFTADADTLLLNHFDSDDLNADASGSLVSLGVQDVTSTAFMAGAYVDTSNKKFGASCANANGGWIGFGGLQMLPANMNALSSWTIEFWYYAGSGTINLYSGVSTGGNSGIFMQQTSGNKVAVWIGNSGWNAINGVSSSASVTNNAWNHVAVSYNGSTYYVGVNGTVSSLGSSATLVSAHAIYNATLGLWSGTGSAASFDELRISITARYTANYTTPSAAFSPDVATLYLNHFDSSASAWQTSAYFSTGSTCFGQTSLWLERSGRAVSGSFASQSGDWTVELWLNPLDNSGSAYSNILCTTNGKYLKLDVNHSNSNKLMLSTGSGSAWSSTALSSNTNELALSAWHHLALVYTSATTTFVVYVDGAAVLSTSSLGASPSLAGIALGCSYGDGFYTGFRGYMSELRVSSTARYSSAFAVSFAPPANDSSTVALLHMAYPIPGTGVLRDDVVANSNSGATVRSALGALAAITGDAWLAPSPSKFGGSLRTTMAGTANNGILTLTAITPPQNVVTIELWFYPSTNSYDGGIAQSGFNSSSWFLHYYRGNGQIAFYSQDYGYWNGMGSGSNYAVLNTWNHIALSYEVGVGYRLYVNGVYAAGMGTGSNWINRFSTIVLGSNSASNNSVNKLTGYFGSIHVRGSRPYSGNFTPPAAEFAADASTLILATFYNADMPTNVQAGEAVTTTATTYPASPWSGGWSFVNSSRTGSWSLNNANIYPVPKIYAPLEVWTVEVWTYFTGSYAGVLQDCVFISFGGMFKIYSPWNGNGLQMYASDYSNNNFINSGASGGMPVNAWTHLAATFNGSQYVLYVNGVAKITLNTTTAPSPSSMQAPTFGGSIAYLDAARWSSTVRYTGTFTPATSWTVDQYTVAQNMFELGSVNTGSVYDENSTPITGTLSRRRVPANAPLYLYAVGHRYRPGYMLSTRNVAAGELSPVMPSGYSSSSMRQLPYVFPTKSDRTLYNMVWDKNRAVFFEDGPQPTHGVVPAQSYTNHPEAYQLNFSALGALTRLVQLKIDKVGGSMTTLRLGPDLVYNYVTCFTDAPGTNSSSETHTVNLDSSQCTAVTISSNPVLNFYVQGFWVTELV